MVVTTQEPSLPQICCTRLFGVHTSSPIRLTCSTRGGSECVNSCHQTSVWSGHVYRQPPRLTTDGDRLRTATFYRGQGYRQRLDSAYAMQIRAMQRLQRRLSTNKNKPSGERPASGGCQGIAVGQFRSRYSGLDRFMLTRGWESTGAGQAANNRSSRFGSGVEYYG